ncbi:MOSC domain-containing protein [Aestuariirhabdus litorea]|uniref:MOSC domain-containing protein n=1 Tax=Aestuariirhabdus litorea TaxID=2528527 RepID=A0A3P3VQP7_9GAMM|nr:MOSC domain-containing protein [Aestuariirhabdus litorea]RRJ84647.1 MOSC domain-containing protein [Aestuariirhabdus litorea]RWW97872.1 MOSC domain-containing protein [Endozoicomonadaceae bacterium GTF-13]
MELTQINLFPLKSARKLSLQQALLDPFGLSGDRRWMVVDPQGRFITARKFPLLATVEVELLAGGLTLQSDGHGPLVVSVPARGMDRKPVVVWGDEVSALDAGDDAAGWLETLLETPCRLVYMEGDCRRQVDRHYAEEGVLTSFADGFPLLLIGEASLRDLNGRLERPVSMDRFRPNLVVSTQVPFEEDRWREIEIGSIRCSVVKPCSRCIMTTVNPLDGSGGREPLRTLSQYRRQSGGVMFGQNLIHRNQGRLSLGDSVRVIS